MILNCTTPIGNEHSLRLKAGEVTHIMLWLNNVGFYNFVVHSERRKRISVKLFKVLVSANHLAEYLELRRLADQHPEMDAPVDSTWSKH